MNGNSDESDEDLQKLVQFFELLIEIDNTSNKTT